MRDRPAQHTSLRSLPPPPPPPRPTGWGYAHGREIPDSERPPGYFEPLASDHAEAGRFELPGIDALWTEDNNGEDRTLRPLSDHHSAHGAHQNSQLSSHRAPASGSLPRSLLREQFDPLSPRSWGTPLPPNGLGDRQRSISPLADDLPDAWDTMLTTITPDATLPSNDSSFTSAAAASASFTAARSNLNSQSTSANLSGSDTRSSSGSAASSRTHLTVPSPTLPPFRPADPECVSDTDSLHDDAGSETEVDTETHPSMGASMRAHGARSSRRHDTPGDDRWRVSAVRDDVDYQTEAYMRRITAAEDEHAEQLRRELRDQRSRPRRRGDPPLALQEARLGHLLIRNRQQRRQREDWLAQERQRYRERAERRRQERERDGNGEMATLHERSRTLERRLDDLRRRQREIDSLDDAHQGADPPGDLNFDAGTDYGVGIERDGDGNALTHDGPTLSTEELNREADAARFVSHFESFRAARAAAHAELRETTAQLADAQRLLARLDHSRAHPPTSEAPSSAVEASAVDAPAAVDGIDGIGTALDESQAAMLGNDPELESMRAILVRMSRRDDIPDWWWRSAGLSTAIARGRL